ncbi:unnamed protein product [Rotaria sp. Silwood1]|nr:unnamed protein product [Rotaria sp. Silwood1]CAF1649460.1 unnamed protein product [Rotaria sp. Silwood1]CAF3810958.1 unnamed protein product [Rotaria sp. Silwood1]CAF3833508.1 unnamed protein product [Rotaria sp. Silwood1]CAF4858159.1 unnamed protein product [Rotaria sp. Silwood1]
MIMILYKKKHCTQLVEYTFDDFISNMITDYNDPLETDNGSEHLRNENKNLSTTIGGFTQEKEKQGKQLNEIQENLVNERATNKQLEKRFNKSQQELNKLKHNFNEEKIMNQQLIQKQNDLMDKMTKQDKEIKALNDQVGDLILHLEGAEKLKVEATAGELATSQIVITSKQKNQQFNIYP